MVGIRAVLAGRRSRVSWKTILGKQESRQELGVHLGEARYAGRRNWVLSWGSKICRT